MQLSNDLLKQVDEPMKVTDDPDAKSMDIDAPKLKKPARKKTKKSKVQQYFQASLENDKKSKDQKRNI